LALGEFGATITFVAANFGFADAALAIQFVDRRSAPYQQGNRLPHHLGADLSRAAVDRVWPIEDPDNAVPLHELG
jgi:hypothetical protein